VRGAAETIENLIVDYRAPVMMAIRIQKTPASFPFKEAWKSAWTVMTLTPTDDGTHLRIASYGYGTDDESLAMRRFFEAGNQLTLETLRRHFGAPAQ
jgi:hypothetical protein